MQQYVAIFCQFDVTTTRNKPIKGETLSSGSKRMGRKKISHILRTFSRFPWGPNSFWGHSANLWQRWCSLRVPDRGGRILYLDLSAAGKTLRAHLHCLGHDSPPPQAGMGLCQELKQKQKKRAAFLSCLENSPKPCGIFYLNNYLFICLK